MNNPNTPPNKLVEMTVWIGNDCNLRCKYCFVYKLNEKQPHAKMTKQTADQLINFANERLTPDGAIWFFGAEPMLNFDIIQYIVEKARANGHNWRFGATTNCTQITQDKVDWMKKYGFGITASIDGIKQTHNTNRVYADGQGTWDDAWKGLSLVTKHLNPNPQIRWTVTPSTTKGLADNIKTFVEEYKRTNLAVDFVYEVQWTPQDLATLRKELETFRDYYREWIQKGIPVFSMFVRDANDALTKPARRWSSRCGLGQAAIGVDYDGSIYPCHRFVGSHQIKIGDIFNGFSVDRLDWIEHWQKASPYCERPQKCLACNYKLACTGGCIAMNYDVFDACHANPEAFCSIKQLVVEVLGDLCKSLQSDATFQRVYRRTQKGKTQDTKKDAPQPNLKPGVEGAKECVKT